jgi:hypothetical protein
MNVSCVLGTAALLLLSLMPAHAETIYPTRWCRVYEDTPYIQIPDQCGTVLPYYPRKLFVRASRRPYYYYSY